MARTDEPFRLVSQKSSQASNSLCTVISRGSMESRAAFLHRPTTLPIILRHLRSMRRSEALRDWSEHHAG
jgi:hypothetical protein